METESPSRSVSLVSSIAGAGGATLAAVSIYRFYRRDAFRQVALWGGIGAGLGAAVFVPTAWIMNRYRDWRFETSRPKQPWWFLETLVLGTAVQAAVNTFLSGLVSFLPPRQPFFNYWRSEAAKGLGVALLLSLGGALGNTLAEID